MDIPSGEVRHFENWLTADQYKKEKADFMDANLEQFVEQYSKMKEFDDLNQVQKQLGAKLMTQFLFGINMAYKRMGMKYQDFDVTFDTANEVDYTIGYWNDENTYIIRLDWFKNEIKKISSGKLFFKNPGGIEGLVPVDDFFELAGVEESAHYMFYNEKGDDRRKVLDTGDPNLDYFTKESEERALIWKKAYAKHYMPQYYDSLSKTANRVLFARKFDEADQKVVRGFESSRVKNKPDGWISPNGVFYGCTPEEHDKCANFLLEHHKEYIDLQLIKNEKYTMRGWQADEIAAREKLKAAGFALLSDDQLSESNLPDTLSLRQMEFAKRNELVFAPQSGQLEVEQYQAFKEEVKNWEGVNNLLERKNKAVMKFMNDPTRTLYVADNDSFAEKVFNALTEKTSGEISLKLLKEKLTWKKFDIPEHGDIYVEYHYHNHGYDATPETEAFIMLTNKKTIKEYLEEKAKTRNYPSGDLKILG